MERYLDVDNISPAGIPNAFIQDELLQNYTYSSLFSRISDADAKDITDTLGKKYKLVHSHISMGPESFVSLYKTKNCHFTVNVSNKQWGGTVAGNSADDVRNLCAELLEQLPPIKEDDPNRVHIKFWSHSRGSASAHLRKIDVQPWETLAPNYPAGVGDALTKIVNLDPVLDGGKLILWHGKPGVGKTHAIRSLAQAWKEWASIEYVIDPEKFFGDASYMLQILLGGEERNPEVDAYLERAAKTARSREKWRLVIIEDAGEYIREDAAAKTGQGLSRLLNLTDGLIGQGLRIIVLMTTNEKFNDLAESVARSGRCLSHLEFQTFGHREATEWLGQAPTGGQTEWTLADLYALKAEQPQILADHEQVRTGIYL